MSCKFLYGLSTARLKPLAVTILLIAQVGYPATYTTPSLLQVGDIYELRRDGWSDPPGGGAYNGDVLPKTDANDGLNGDNPYFRRQNVARAWSSGTGYWFTAADQYEGEPDPAGGQWVDYAPPFEILGSGRYAIDGSYRWSATRASYPAVYHVCHSLGISEVLRDQRTSASTGIVWFSLGEFEMRPGSFVRVEDTGTESITFANMSFRLVAPAPLLRIESVGVNCAVRWPTNAVGYRLESITKFCSAPSWEAVAEPPEQVGRDYQITLPSGMAARFFRLVSP